MQITKMRHQPKLRRSKRLQISKSHPNIKRRKLNVVEQRSTMKITDLNDDCLQIIFGFLDLRDVFSVAVSSEWLRFAAGSVFTRKFVKKSLLIDIHRRCQNKAIDTFNTAPTAFWIKVQDMKTCLQFIRCFGTSITQVVISRQLNNKYSEYLDQYLSEYCSNTLVDISIYDNAHFSAMSFQKPFTKLQDVFINNSDLSNQLPSFVKWFPNLRYLQLCEVRVDRRFVGASFPHLEHLFIEINNHDPRDGFSPKNVADLLRLNPQLRSLSINLPGYQRTTLSTLLNIVSRDSSISELNLSTESYSARANAAELIGFAKGRPSLVQIDLEQFRFSVDDVIQIIRQLKALNWFRFMLESDAELNHLRSQLDDEWRASTPMIRVHPRRCTVILERNS